jgi:hypothetical protein
MVCFKFEILKAICKNEGDAQGQVGNSVAAFTVHNQLLQALGKNPLHNNSS